MSSLAEGLIGLLVRMNSDGAVLSKIVPKRPTTGEPIGGVVAVSQDHWPAVEMLIDEYNQKHAGAYVTALADLKGNLAEEPVYSEIDDDEDRQKNGIGG